METGFKTRLAPLSYQIATTLLLAWAVISIPSAVILGVADAKDSPRLLQDPVAHFAEQVKMFFGGEAFLTHLQPWEISFAYVIILVLGLAWHYWQNIVVRSREEFELATKGVLGAVDAQQLTPNIVEAAAMVGGAGTVFYAGSVLNAVAFYGAALGPIGWTAILAVGGVAAVVGGVLSAGSRQEKADQHARDQTIELERRRVQLAQEAAEEYRKVETRKFLIAASTIFAILSVYFARQVLSHYLWA